MSLRAQPLQLWSPFDDEASANREIEYGAVFTRRWVVELILDLVGYTASQDLGAMQAVEPACGSGAFLGAMAERLIASCRAHGRRLADASGAIRAFDLQDAHVATSRANLERVLVADGCSITEAVTLAQTWVTKRDYLLTTHEDQAVDFVIGNPPYIRLEDLADEQTRAYRRACPTMVGRSDIYVGFFEVGLRSLRAGGVLGFICADRWMRNQYGKQLRRLVTDEFSVVATITMHDVDAFEATVSAYPAISILRRAQQGESIAVDTRAGFGPGDARKVVDWIGDESSSSADNPRYSAARLTPSFSGDDSWPAGSPARLALIEELNARFAPLQNAASQTRVGIGIATGADSIYVTDDPTLVEPDRILPLSMVRDTRAGRFEWSGHYLVNPWCADGSLVSLTAYPRLRAHFEAHRDRLVKRNVAGRRPKQWFRTIDKVEHSLTGRSKLLFPDMKMSIHPVLEEGGYYPHHNLYFVVSDTWDLEVLGGLLLSKVAEAFVEAYAVKMRGGTLRFQAQYLRRIRVPSPEQVDATDARALRSAFRARDSDAATRAAIRVYGIESHEGAFCD